MTMTPTPDPVMSWQLALAIGLAAGVVLGLALYYLADRLQFLPGITFRLLRHAAWARRRTAAARLAAEWEQIAAEQTAWSERHHQRGDNATARVARVRAQMARHFARRVREDMGDL